ncbi:hypothetical protein AVEN_230684-1 [Araneus ventricosus]|uniref:Uncharacterized protein n=1 Tax=Araneus ventricosus TaxID=182803 RepID=A0A4Y2A1X8_ARAVE|nr:hypothetical protein AVEN_230684-1 [Araneus ventricosus]
MTAAAITSSTEAGVLVSSHLSTGRPLPKEVRTITGGGTQSPTITIPTGEESSSLLNRQQFKSDFVYRKIDETKKKVKSIRTLAFNNGSETRN